MPADERPGLTRRLTRRRWIAAVLAAALPWPAIAQTRRTAAALPLRLSNGESRAGLVAALTA
jgi:hypothetical protein